MTLARPLTTFVLLCLGLLPSPVVPAGEVSFDKGVNVANWLVYYPEGGYADPGRFAADDVQWLAGNGFDHIRIPTDGSVLLNVEGRPIAPLIEPIDRALDWAANAGLGVVLELHVMPGVPLGTGADGDKRWTDPAWTAAVVNFWSGLAERYRDIGPGLRFEILTVAGTPTAAVADRLNRRIVEAVRAVDKDRVIYVSTHGSGEFDHVEDTPLFKGDPNVHYVFHFYEPLVFAIQGVPWDERFSQIKRNIPFPMHETGLDEYFPPGDPQLKYNNRLIDETYIDRRFTSVKAWADTHKADVYISEFAVYNRVDAASRERYIRAIRKACERNGFAWAVWDYNGDFGVRAGDQRTAVWEGLFLEE